MKMHVTPLKTTLLFGMSLALATPVFATTSSSSSTTKLSAKVDIRMGSEYIEGKVIKLNDGQETKKVAIDVKHLGLANSNARKHFSEISGATFKGDAVLVDHVEGSAPDISHLLQARDEANHIVEIERTTSKRSGRTVHRSTHISLRAGGSDDVFRDRKPRNSELKQIRQQVFGACSGMSANEKVECYSEQMSEYHQAMEDAGATESQIKSRMKSAFGKFHGRLKSMLKSKDEDTRETGQAALDSLMSDPTVASYFYGKLERLERSHAKHDKKFKRLARVKELSDDYKEECADAEHPSQVHRALSRLARSTNRNTFHKVGNNSKCLSKAGFNNGLGGMQTPFGMNGMQCMGDFCLPGMGMNNMFNQGRCNNMGYGSSMIGAFPQMGMPQQGMHHMGMPMPRSPMMPGMTPRPMPGMHHGMHGMPHMPGMQGGMGCGFGRMAGMGGMHRLGGVGGQFMGPMYGGNLPTASVFRGHPLANFYGQSQYGSSLVRSPIAQHRGMPFGPQASPSARHNMGWPTPTIGGPSLYNNTFGARSRF